MSPTHPEIVGADFTSSGHGVASCTAADFEDTATYRWNTGHSSKVEGRVTINLKPNGQTVLVRIGTVTGGLFKDATVTQTKILPALNLLDCATDDGLRSRISTDDGTCGSNGLPAWVNFPLYAHGDRASR